MKQLLYTLTMAATMTNINAQTKIAPHIEWSVVPGQVTTTALLWQGDIIISAGEISAGVRTPQIISGKINGRHAK